MIEKLSNLDGRIIYGLLLVSMIVPLLKPLGLPLTTPAETTAMYDMIEALPAGSAVVFSMDTSPGGYDELGPGSIAVMSHLAKKSLKVIGMSFIDAGPSLLQKAFDSSLMREKEYGKDYINLGYVAGGENAMAAVSRDVPGMFPVDFNGASSAGMPIMEGIKTLSDVKLVICVASGTPGVQEWIRQVGDPLKVPISTIVIAGLYADYAPYMQSKQLVGLTPGLRGAAGYEALIGILGRGTAGIDAQSVAHLVILILVAFGNVLYLMGKNKKAGKVGQE